MMRVVFWLAFAVVATLGLRAHSAEIDSAEPCQSWRGMSPAALEATRSAGFTCPSIRVAEYAQLNTTELEAAMETCRKHIVPYQGEYVYDKGWEDCNAINVEWQAMRGSSPLDPSADKAKIHQYLMKRLQ